MNSVRSRPSRGLVVGVIVLSVAMAGTAIAGPDAITRALTKSKVKQISKKQANKQIKKKASGLSVASADTATRAGSAAQVDTLQVDPVNVEATVSPEADAPETELLAHGPFTIYAKCYLEGGFVFGRVYVRTTEAGAVLESDNDTLNGDGDGYLNPNTLEEFRQIETDVGASANDAQSQSSYFDVVLDSTKLQGEVATYAKNGTLPAGNGTYGPGNRCIFDAYATQTAG